MTELSESNNVNALLQSPWCHKSKVKMLAWLASSGTAGKDLSPGSGSVRVISDDPWLVEAWPPSCLLPHRCSPCVLALWIFPSQKVYYSSVAVIKTHDQKQLKGLFLLTVLEGASIVVGKMRHGGRSRKLTDHSSSTKEGAGGGQRQREQTNRMNPSLVYFLQQGYKRFHHVPKQRQLGTRCSNIWTYGRHFFEPPKGYRFLMNSLPYLYDLF